MTDVSALTDLPSPVGSDYLLSWRGSAPYRLGVVNIVYDNGAGFFNLGSKFLIGGANSATSILGSGTAFNTGGAAIVARGITAGFNNGGIEFMTGSGATGTEAARINASGQLLVGNTGDWTGGFEKLHVKTTLTNGRGISAWNSNITGGSAFLARSDAANCHFLSCYFGASSQIGALYTDGTNFNLLAGAAFSIVAGGSVVALTAQASGIVNFNKSVQYNGAYSSTYHMDTTPAATVIANSGTLDFANFSGMLIVNNWGTGGVSTWICGGGTVTLLGTTGAAVGTLTFTAGVYRFTNNTGTSQTYGVAIIRTRTTA